MALNDRYVLDVTLEPMFIDKRTGLPLAAGKVFFFEDDNRNTLKPVYELTGSPPNYTYGVMPNPIILSSVGTIQDADENNVAIYYLPYVNDTSDEVQLYYITVEAEDGTPMFTREAWPNTIQGEGPGGSSDSAFSNQILNSQFVDIFNEVSSDAGLTVTYSGNSITTAPIGPNWFLSITHTGGGSVTVNRISTFGTQYIPTNPPYYLEVVSGSNITNLEVIQRLESNTNIFSSAFVATSVTVGSTSQVSVYYRPSTPAASDTLLLTANNTSGAFKEFTDTVAIGAIANTEDSSTGYVDLVFSLGTGTTQFTSAQVTGLNGNIQGIEYEQVPVVRQRGELFNYYNPLLTFKPIPSYLVGWDFPLNPAQWGTALGPFAVGSDKSVYVWDQTIIFQASDSGFTVDRGIGNGLEITSAIINSQVAVIQYLEAAQARELLQGKMAVHIRAYTGVSPSVNGVISLYYTDDANLPAMGSNNSLVATLSSSGKPATFNGAGWTEVPRGTLGDASFQFIQTVSNEFLDYSFNGWELAAANIADKDTATFFAIVIGTELLDNADAFELMSVSLCAGDIATIPAPQTKTDVLSSCERYYEKSYAQGDVAGTSTNSNSIIRTQGAYLDTLTYRMVAASFSIEFKSEKYSASPVVTIYNPSGGTAAQVLGSVFGKGSASAGTGNIATTIWTANAKAKGVYYNLTTYNEAVTEGSGAGGGSASGAIRFHYVADSRLGIV